MQLTLVRKLQPVSQNFHFNLASGGHFSKLQTFGKCSEIIAALCEHQRIELFL